MRSRRLFREQKNYERGLKMVPLMIHLPPISDDTELGGRDARRLARRKRQQSPDHLQHYRQYLTERL